MIPNKYRGTPEGVLISAGRRYEEALHQRVRFDAHEILFKAAIAYAESKGYAKEAPTQRYELLGASTAGHRWRCESCGVHILSSTTGYPGPHECSAHWTTPPYRGPEQTIEYRLPTNHPPGATGIRIGSTYIDLEGDPR